MSRFTMFLIIINFILLIAISPLEEVENAYYECKTKACVCEVSNNSRTSLYEEGDEIILNRQLQSLYFNDEYYSLNRTQISQIDRFMVNAKMYKNAMYWPFKITVISYFNGDLEIAEKRAHAIREVITTRNPSASFNLLSAKSSEKNRVDILLHAENNLTTLIKAIPADYYLVDTSASMKEEINIIKKMIDLSSKPNSRVYVSMTSGCKDNQSFGSIIPQGPTEIFYSYRMLLDIIEPGSSLVVITDINSSFPITEQELKQVEELGMKRGITVNIIQ